MSEPEEKFKVIFNSLIETTKTNLYNNFPNEFSTVDSARENIFGYFSIACQFLQNVKNVTDKSTDLKNSVVSPILNRCIYENFLIFAFLLEDIPNNMIILYKTQYKEQDLLIKSWETGYANIDRLQPRISSRKVRNDKLKVKYSINTTTSDSEGITSGFTPEKMLRILRREHPTTTLIPLIEFLNSVLYKELSGLSHLSPFWKDELVTILDDQDFPLGTGVTREDKESWADTQKAISVFLMALFFTEIEMKFNYGEKENLKYLWSELIPLSEIFEEGYKFRYESYFNS